MWLAGLLHSSEVVYLKHLKHLNKFSFILYLLFIMVDNGVDFSIWQDSCYVMSFLQRLLHQVIDDVITSSLRGKKAMVCFQYMALCLFQWVVLKNRSCRFCKFILSQVKNSWRTAGIELGSPLVTILWSECSSSDLAAPRCFKHLINSIN